MLAVKNTLAQPIKLVNLPELLIETRGAQNQAINRERWEVMGLAHTLPPDGLLQPGQVYRFALVSRPPILGAAQFLSLAVAQTNAGATANGAFGYFTVTELPAESATEPAMLPPLPDGNAGLGQLSDDEAAALLATGDTAKIRAAWPRLKPETRQTLETLPRQQP